MHVTQPFDHYDIRYAIITDGKQVWQTHTHTHTDREIERESVGSVGHLFIVR